MFLWTCREFGDCPQTQYYLSQTREKIAYAFSSYVALSLSLSLALSLSLPPSLSLLVFLSLVSLMCAHVTVHRRLDGWEGSLCIYNETCITVAIAALMQADSLLALSPTIHGLAFCLSFDSESGWSGEIRGAGSGIYF